MITIRYPWDDVLPPVTRPAPTADEAAPPAKASRKRGRPPQALTAEHLPFGLGRGRTEREDGHGEMARDPALPDRGEIDWLPHSLTVTGPAERVVAFQEAARGAGIVPWVIDYAALEEDLFQRLVVSAAGSRRLSLEGARIFAAQFREKAERRHTSALQQIGPSRACPFDLHALVPVPEAVLQLGPDHPRALAWLWENWGITRELRRVEVLPVARQRRLRPGHEAARIAFVTADWSPWRALVHIRQAWPELRFQLQPDYTPVE